MNLSRRADLALQQIDRLAAHYSRVEAKASFVFFINAGMISIALINAPADSISWVEMAFVYLCIFITLVILSMIEVALCLFPHTKGATSISNIYFKDIAARDCNHFVQEYRSQTESDIIEDASMQIWRNSEILTKKFASVDRAGKLSLLAVIPWILLMWNFGELSGRIVIS